MERVGILGKLSMESVMCNVTALYDGQVETMVCYDLICGTVQKRKRLQQKLKQSSKEQSDTTDPFKITIEMVSFSEYYPHLNLEKFQ
jgi:hypothetical protein